MSTEATDTTDKTLVPIEWLPQGKVRFLDQSLLPNEERWVEIDDYRLIAEAIRRLQLRGTPLIGIAEAYGLKLAAAVSNEVESAAAELRSTRTIEINPSWAFYR